MLKFIILGIIQGLTEFLPVSSSGHLVVAQKLLGIPGQELSITVLLHLGTLLAVIIFFFKDILRLIRNLKFVCFVLIVTAITGIVALAGKDFLEGLFSSARAVAWGWIFTGTVLLLTKKFSDGKRREAGFKDAAVLGLAQAIAVAPGISRSGLTVSSLLFRGIEPEAAFRFSFIASIPAITGAAFLEAKDIGFLFKGQASHFAIGILFSFLFGIFSLWLLRGVLRRAKLYYFGVYCIIAAVLTLLFIK